MASNGNGNGDTELLLVNMFKRQRHAVLFGQATKLIRCVKFESILKPLKLLTNRKHNRIKQVSKSVFDRSVRFTTNYHIKETHATLIHISTSCRICQK